MNLSDISRTAIITLVQRVVETESKKPGLSDSMVQYCFDGLLKLSTGSEREQFLDWKRKYRYGLGAISRKGVVDRGRNIDMMVSDFLCKKPHAAIVELACGLDTRYWRIGNNTCTYFEIDMPEIIALRKEIFNDENNRKMIESSVLDFCWTENVTKHGNTDFLIIAEGLFMYLPPDKMASLFDKLSEVFNRSQMIFDLVPKTQTRGFWKNVITSVFKKQFGLDVSYEFGLEKVSNIESYSKSFRLLSTKKCIYGPILSVSINE